MLPETLNLDYLNARRLLLPSYERITLALIGCGGTGSWLAPHVARVARLLIDKFQKQVSVFFIDPDQVEEKNCYRQNFCPAEIGKNKAYALAFRLGLAWGLEINAVPMAFEAKILNDTRGDGLKILIGCVDNAAARESIRDTCSSFGKCWWLDCGNHQASGQVLIGSGSLEPKNPHEFPGACSWLPLPSDRHPDLLEAIPEETPMDTSRMSCADLAMIDSQGLATNVRIAAEAADYLVRLLLTRDLCKWGSYIDLASGTTRSKYIVGGSDE